MQAYMGVSMSMSIAVSVARHLSGLPVHSSHLECQSWHAVRSVLTTVCSVLHLTQLFAAAGKAMVDMVTTFPWRHKATISQSANG
jgi:hypothetical protein